MIFEKSRDADLNLNHIDVGIKVNFISNGHWDILADLSSFGEPIDNSKFFHAIGSLDLTTDFDRKLFASLQTQVAEWHDAGIEVPPLHINKEAADLLTSAGRSQLSQQSQWAHENDVDLIVEITERAMAEMTTDGLTIAMTELTKRDLGFYLDDLNTVPFKKICTVLETATNIKPSIRGIKIDLSQASLTQDEELHIIDFANQQGWEIIFEMGEVTPEDLAGMPGKLAVQNRYFCGPEIKGPDMAEWMFSQQHQTSQGSMSVQQL